MLGGVLRFEWRYQTRQVSFYVAAVAFLLMGFVFVGTGYGPDNVHVNSPYTIMQSLGLLSLFSVFVLSLFCANAALRDTEHKMEELVYATSIGKLTYLSARFAGALLAALTVFTVAALGLMVAPSVVAVDPERLGSTELLRYVWALAVMVLPNLVFAASLLFAVSVLTRSALASYVGAVFVYALYMVGSLLGDSPLMAGAATQTPEAMARSALLDPFGLSAFFTQTRYWTEHERNTRLLGLEGPFLLNRALWLGVSAGVLALVYRLFAFRVSPGTKTVRDDAGEGTASASVYRPVASRGLPGAVTWAALRSATRLELRYVLRSGSFLALLAFWVLVVGMEVGAGAPRGEYGTRIWPTTGLLFDSILQPLSLMGTLTLIYYGAELVWRERYFRIDAVLDATPASSAVFYLSKAAALALLTVILTVTAVGIAVLYQLVRGYHHVEPGLYLSLLYFKGLPLLLFAVAVLFVQALSPNRYVGMLLGLLLALLVHRGELVGLEHGLLRYAGGPPVRHSDMDGFGAVAGSFAAFMVYWSAFAGLLVLVTCGLWRRGVSPSLRARFAALPRQWGRRGLAGVAACLGVFVATGGFIFHGTNLANRYETDAQQADWKADYEKTYKKYETLAQPSVVAVKADVGLFPEERRYRVAGAYRLENRTQEPIETVWVAVRRDVRKAELKLDGARLRSHDARFGMSEFRLERSLTPGARAELRFDVEVASRGVHASDLDTSIVGNGSFITNLEAFPSIGYRKTYELGDARERRERGLPELPLEVVAEDEPGLAHGGSRERAWATLDTTVSTSEDQLAGAPGVLRREWREHGRRYFHYVMERPINPWFAYVSARYAVEKTRHRGVDVEVYYHPAHGTNVQRILQAATRSLEVFSEQFGPYPHEQLRIVEVPSYADFGALALPGTIYFPEHRGFLADPSNPEDIDLVTRRIAHEVAHQWWGHQVDPADGAGATTLNESLAKYSEQLVLRAVQGESHLRRLLGFELDRYLTGRTGEKTDEPPLSEARQQAHLYYAKGALVMNALRDLMGEAALNRALSRLVREHGHPNESPTTHHLLAALRAEAPEGHHALIDQWMKQVVLYDLKVESATYEPLADGRYRVTARIGAAKTARRGGSDSALDVDEQLDIAVFTRHPDTLSDAEPALYSAKHRITGASTELSFVVNEKPAYVSVDPSLLRIELERGDNLQQVEDGERR
ncbi:ABC transporter permease/M1 family aminopeptidase [Pyxidicoccus sp. 3LG]